MTDGHSLSEQALSAAADPAQSPDPPPPRYVQYRAGEVSESLRQAHRVVADRGDVLVTRCGSELVAWRVEDTSALLKPPEPDKAIPRAPCVICVLRDMAAVDLPR